MNSAHHVTDSTSLGANWRKSSYTGAQGSCVEISEDFEELVPLRDSKRPHGPALLLSRAQFAGLVDAIRAGQFGA